MVQKPPDDAIQHTQPVENKMLEALLFFLSSKLTCGSQHIPPDFEAMHTLGLH
jgi:hypothetical protein